MHFKYCGFQSYILLWGNRDAFFSGRRTWKQIFAPPEQDAVKAEGRQQARLGKGAGHGRKDQDLHPGAHQPLRTHPRLDVLFV